jgi:hypothetical protein
MVDRNNWIGHYPVSKFDWRDIWRPGRSDWLQLGALGGTRYSLRTWLMQSALVTCTWTATNRGLRLCVGVRENPEEDQTGRMRGGSGLAYDAIALEIRSSLAAYLAFALTRTTW